MSSPTELFNFVRGYYYRCRMANGADFEVWSAVKLSRTEARKRLLALANGDYVGDGEVVYDGGDMTNFWEARS